MTFKLISFLYLFLGFSFALSLTSNFDVHISRIIVLVAAFLWFAESILKQKKIFIPKGVVSFFLFCFIFWNFGSIFYSEVPGWTLRKIIFLFNLSFVFIILVDWFVRDFRNLEKFIKFVVVGAGMISIVGILQFVAQFIFSRDLVANFWAMLTPFFLGGVFSKSVSAYNSWYVHVAGVDVFRAIAFFPDPHVFSFYLGAILPFALFLYIKTNKNIWLLTSIIILLADLFTFSRGGQVALIAGFLVFVLISRKHTKTKFKHMLQVVVVIFILILSTIGSSFYDRFSSSFDMKDNSASHRIVLWKQAFQNFLQNPIIGVGLGAYPHTVDKSADYRKPIYVHNTFLDILVESGIIGAFFFLFLIGSMLKIFIENDSLYAGAGIVSISILATHGIFDTAIFSIHVYLVFIFLASLASYYENIK